MRSEEGFVIAGTSMEEEGEKEEEEGGEAIGKFLITPRLGEEPSVEKEERKPPFEASLPYVPPRPPLVTKPISCVKISQ